VLGAVLLVFLLAQATPAAASASPSPCPSPAASGSRCIIPSSSPYDQLRLRLNADLAAALTTQQQLSAAVAQVSATALLLADEITQDEARISDLQSQLVLLDQQISDLEARIVLEKQQVSSLARALYQQPDSFLGVIANSGNLGDALASSADLVVAGQRAHALQERLKSDLDQVQADRAARQADLDQVAATMAQVQSNVAQLAAVQAQLNGLVAQLSTLISKIGSAAGAMTGLPSSVTEQLATLLEQQEQQLIAESNAAAWAQANVGAGLANDFQQLPAGIGPSGLSLSWPLVHFTITQPFGPTTYVLEPPLGSYPHFHTGVDLAATLGAPVLAAADGVVVAVAHTMVGYGNYVIIAHGGGVLTLYAHLLETDVVVGQHVTRSQAIGREGSSGLSTGPHVHFELRYNGQVVNPLLYLPQ
jgi:murein DD-endopeptidase MepM/ murein hydrolase activator NlpD